MDGEIDGKPFTTLPKNLYCEIKRIAIFFKISLQKRTNLHRSFNDDFYGNDALYNGFIITAVLYFMLHLCGSQWRCQKINHNIFLRGFFQATGSGSSVSIVTGYGLDGPRIESRWGRDFPHLSRPALGSTQPTVQWVPVLSRG